MTNEVDTETIIENLTELLQNTVNMTSVFYDIFINPTPMDVTLTQYDSEGELITITVPNRAKDLQRALIGTGSPEGVISASEGTLYVDSATQTAYVKVNGSGNTGWKIILTEEGVYTYVRNYLLENGYYSTETLERYLTENGYVRDNEIESIVEEATESKQDALTAGTGITIDNNTISATGMTVPIDTIMSPASVNPVQNKVIYNNVVSGVEAGNNGELIVTKAGETTTIPISTTVDSSLNPSSTNPVQNAIITSVLASKGTLVTSISAASTDLEYPSAKCLYDLIGDLETILQSIIDGNN